MATNWWEIGKPVQDATPVSAEKEDKQNWWEIGEPVAPVNQPVSPVQQQAPKQPSTGFFSGIGRAVENIGSTISEQYKQFGAGLSLSAIDSLPDSVSVPPSGISPDELERAGGTREWYKATLGISSDEELKRLKDTARQRYIQQVQASKQRIQELTPEDLNIYQRGLRGGLESLAVMAPGAALSLITRTPGPALTAAGTTTFGGSYAEARAEGKDPNAALAYGGIDAAIEVATELIPAKKLLDALNVSSKKDLIKVLGEFAAKEIPGEQIATALQSLNGLAFGLDEELANAQTPEEFARIQGERQAITAISTIVAGGAQAGAIGAVNSARAEMIRRDIESQVRDIEEVGSQLEREKLEELRQQALKEAGAISAPELSEIQLDEGQQDATPVQYGAAYADKVFGSVGQYIPANAEFTVEQETVDGTDRYVVKDKDGVQYGQALQDQNNAQSFADSLNNISSSRAELFQELQPLEASLRETMRGFGLNDIGLTLSDRIFTRRGEALTSEGLFDPVVRRVFLAVDAINPDGTMDADQRRQALRGVLRHEVVHALRYLDLWKRSEWKNLENTVSRTVRPGTDKTYLQIAQENYGDQNEVVQVEEAVAELIRDVADNQARIGGKPRTLSERAINFFDKAKNALTGAGFQTYEDIVQRFERGEIGARERGKIRTFRGTEERQAEQGVIPERLQRLFTNPVERNRFREEIAQNLESTAPAGTTTPVLNFLRSVAARESRVTLDPAPARILVDGKEKPTSDSEGRQIYSGAETQDIFPNQIDVRPTKDGLVNFWRWFGNSAAKDSMGRPLVYYHGTAADIESFRPKQAGAVFITRAPAFAEDFAQFGEQYLETNFTEFMSPDEVLSVLNETLASASAFTPKIWDQVAGIREKIARDIDAGKESIDPKIANDLSEISKKRPSSRFSNAISRRLPSAGNIIPVYVRAENPWDYNNQDDINAVLRQINTMRAGGAYIDDVDLDFLRDGDWGTIEKPAVIAAIRALGHDSIYVKEMGERNLAVFDPNQVKSAIGNNGDYGLGTPRIRESRGGAPQYSNVGDPLSLPVVSTRVPTAKPKRNAPAVEDPIATRLQIGLQQYTSPSEPTLIQRTANLFRGYINTREVDKSLPANELVEKLISDIQDNLVWLFDSVPENIRNRSKLWYVGANRIADTFAKKYGLTQEQVSGVLAVNSPQTEWFTNVTRAERILDIFLNKKDVRWTPTMNSVAGKIFAKPEYSADLSAITGKTLSEIAADKDTTQEQRLVRQAMWIRAYDESHNSRNFRIVTPEGAFGDFVKKDSGGTAIATWANLDHIAKSIAMIEDASLRSISENLGLAHKVRSFYSNIIAPDDINGEVTIDTHAVAAAHLRPLSGNSIEVKHNLGAGVSSALSGVKGTYGIYAEAYRRAAEQVGVLPRELQSITWEAIRGLYTDVFKRSNKARDVENSWTEYAAGRKPLSQVRTEIVASAGGINEPNWWQSNREAPSTTWSSSYGGDLLEFRVPGGDAGSSTGGDVAGSRGRGGESATGAVAPAAREARRRPQQPSQTPAQQPGPTTNQSGTAAAGALNNGQPVNSLGIPTGPQVTATNPNGTVSISDARLPSGFKQLIMQMIRSAPDKLRSGIGLDQLATRIENYYDAYAAKLGSVNGIIRDAFDKIPMGQRTKALETFEEFIRARENGRAQVAATILANASPAERALIDAWSQIAQETGRVNLAVRTPEGDPMKVWDSKANNGKGAWRAIRTVRDFFPRTFRKGVMEVMKNPDVDPQLWDQLLDSLVTANIVATRQDAIDYLSREFFPDNEYSKDYFSGVERARQKPLPEIFYDYSWDAATRYLSKWARRTSQIENFGQDLGKFKKDWFGKNLPKVRDTRTQQYLLSVRDRIYEVERFDIIQNAISWANSLATAVQLGNPISASLNLLGGTINNVQQFGIASVAKSYKDLLLEWKKVQKEGTTLGILNKDVMNILSDHVDMDVDKYLGKEEKISKALNKFANVMLNIGLFNGAENVVRASAMLSARAWLNDALAAINSNPNSAKSQKFIKWITTENLDLQKLILENGSGKETEKFMRRAVNVPQGSYKIDMTPVFIDTPAGRFLFKYQKFGTQVNRFAYNHFLKPAWDNPTPRNMVRALGFVGTAVLGGQAILMIREAFGYGDPGPDEEEILEAFSDEEVNRGLLLLWNRAYQNAIAAGSLGFFGNYLQLAKDFQDQLRVKNPMSPPGLASMDSVVEIFRRLLDQGKLTAGDLDEIAQSGLSFYRANKRIGLAAMDAIGSDAEQVKLFAADRNQREIREFGRRFSEEMDIEFKRRFAPGAFAKTPMSPTNRDIADALLIGDSGKARALAREALRGKSAKERERIMASIKSSVRSQQPIQVGGSSPNREQREQFLRWARQNLPPEKYRMVVQTDRKYRNAARRAELGFANE